MNHEDAIYRDVEDMVRPILESNARRFARQLGMNYDEAIAEARFGLLLALRRYSYNDSRGGIYNFVKTAIRRHFLKKWAVHKTQRRRPHVRVVDESGDPQMRPVGFAPHSDFGDFMDTLPADVTPRTAQVPSAELEAAESERLAADFMKALEAALTGRDPEVLRCKYAPPRGLRMIMLDELASEPTIPLIGRFLGMSKNEVDWALRRIRVAALKIIANDFSELRDLSIVRSYVGG